MLSGMWKRAVAGPGMYTIMPFWAHICGRRPRADAVLMLINVLAYSLFSDWFGSLLPIIVLCNVQVSGNLKWVVCGLMADSVLGFRSLCKLLPSIPSLELAPL